MKFRKRYLFLLIPILLVVLFFSGPRIDLSIPEYMDNVPDTNLDQWLKAQEEAVGNIKPGTEKKIYWAGNAGVKTPLSIVSIHGFTNNRQGQVPILDHVAEQLHVNIFHTRLKGHGMGADGYQGVKIGEWVNDTREAGSIGKKIGEKVFLFAVSTGGPLAMWLYNEDPTYDGIILIVPNFKPADVNAEMILWPWGNLIVKTILGEYRETEPENEIQRKYADWRHHSDALFPMMGSVAIARDLPYEKFDVPVLIICTDNDEVVSVDAIEQIYNRLPNKNKKLINYPEAGGHLICGQMSNGKLDDKIVANIVEFIRNTTEN